MLGQSLCACMCVCVCDDGLTCAGCRRGNTLWRLLLRPGCPGSERPPLSSDLPPVLCGKSNTVFKTLRSNTDGIEGTRREKTGRERDIEKMKPTDEDER